ncbi:NUDIX domain-containing protein [Kribbella sp. NPDC059898]|uniref:NUDIX domain-containing protein n=1 Tax=Kribbella sp. NPDC059898 TaxID=3346995 RepID=UPI00364EE76A
MARRIDYYDDPGAPAANSMVPSVNVVIENEAGEILMIERSDNGNWALPGGAIDLGESMSQAGVRETKEETGIDCEILDVLGIYTWIPPSELNDLQMNSTMRRRIDHYLEPGATFYFD